MQQSRRAGASTRQRATCQLQHRQAGSFAAGPEAVHAVRAATCCRCSRARRRGGRPHRQADGFHDQAASAATCRCKRRNTCSDWLSGALEDGTAARRHAAPARRPGAVSPSAPTPDRARASSASPAASTNGRLNYDAGLVRQGRQGAAVAAGRQDQRQLRVRARAHGNQGRHGAHRRRGAGQCEGRDSRPGHPQRRAGNRRQRGRARCRSS
jgi:hypothetical protein